MSAESVCRLFRGWLSRNGDRFRFAPRIVLATSHSLTVDYRGVTLELLLSVYNDGQIMVGAGSPEDVWDFLTDFDCCEARDDSGLHFCRLCAPEERMLHPSRAQLYERHSFEPLLEWVNENFRASRWLAFYRTANIGTSWANLFEESELEQAKSREHLIRAIPIIQRPSLV